MQTFRTQLTAGVALAALLTGPVATSGVVYEKVDLFKGKTLFTDSFEVGSSGGYRTTLTDFEFPRPMKRMGLHVTSSGDSLGSLFAPGSFDFEAEPGTYYVSFFALASQGKKSNKGNKGNKGNKSNNGNKDSGSRGKKRDRPAWAGEGGMMNLGQYGIEIASLDAGGGIPEYPGDGTAVVPVPAAVWLFASGLLGITGLGFRRKRSRV
jgi:hypothetical protein